MRLAVSGSHGTGKSTLIAAFLAVNPGYASEPEAFELLGGEITILPGDGPDIDGLEALIELTLDTVSGYASGASVIFERCAVDYLAYAAENEALPVDERVDFVDRYIPAVREAMRHLDLIVLLPVSAVIAARSGEEPGFRDRVDDELRRLLLDDDLDLFDSPDAPRVVELSPHPERWLATLRNHVASSVEAVENDER